MTPTAQRPYRGVFPVAPTIFDELGDLDLAGQRRCIDFMIDAGSNGLCILANFSEQFVLTDAERVYWRLYAAREELKLRGQQYDLAWLQLERARRCDEGDACAGF